MSPAEEETFFKTASISEILQSYNTFLTSGLSESAARLMEGGLIEMPGHRVATHLTILEDTTRALLRKENPMKEQEYIRRLAEKLDSIQWQRAGTLRYMIRFDAEYDILCDTVMSQGLGGMWPIVCYDLMQPLDLDLLHPRVPALITRHPDVLMADDISLADARRVSEVFRSAAGEANARINPGKVIEVILKAAELFLRIADLAEKVVDYWEKREKERKAHEQEAEQRAREEAEKARAKAEREVERARSDFRDATPIEGARDYVDRFERNGELIGRTC
jgi:hypothetical protein